MFPSLLVHDQLFGASQTFHVLLLCHNHKYNILYGLSPWSFDTVHWENVKKFHSVPFNGESSVLPAKNYTQHGAQSSWFDGEHTFFHIFMIRPYISCPNVSSSITLNAVFAGWLSQFQKDHHFQYHQSYFSIKQREAISLFNWFLSKWYLNEVSEALESTTDMHVKIAPCFMHAGFFFQWMRPCSMVLLLLCKSWWGYDNLSFRHSMALRLIYSWAEGNYLEWIR